jgi:GNAT superfamily N-acetyltransferase
MKIRKFQKRDAKKVSSLIIKNQREVLSKYYPKKVIDFFCRRRTPEGILEASKKRDYFVAVERNRILGINGLKNNKVKTMFVNPKYHKKNIGRRLMENLENIAKKRKIKKLIVHSTPYAERFYKRCGFKRLKKIISSSKDIKWPEIIMEKSIK